MRRLVIVWILPIIILTACGSFASSSGTTDPVILASSTTLTDIVRRVAGDRIQVAALLPMGADPHSYQPTPQDAAKIEQSPLIILNGLDYEHSLEALFANAAAEKMIIEASAGINPREDAEGGHGVDPHVWLDPNLVLIQVENIREALTHYDPDGAALYQANADAYIAELKELDLWIKDQVAQIPDQRKLLITNHEALGYFAERYGFVIAGSVIESFSSDAAPSAQQMAGLIDQVNRAHAPAIFLDAGDNPALAQQIAAETGVRVIVDLHLESLTDGAPAATYIDMMKYNVTQIVNALK